MSQVEKTAVVLVNLGTPEQANEQSVRAFLGEFLADSRVIEGHGPRRWLWLAILNLIVLRTRPKKVAKLYQDIWKEDSPMRIILHNQVDELQKSLTKIYSNPPQVFAAMTYGASNLTSVLQQLQQQKYSQVFVMPLFPQYSATSTGPVYDKVAQFQKNARDVLDIRILKSYYNHHLYIQALAQSIEKHWSKHQPAQKLMFSYHGIPQQYADDGDPYPQQCFETTRLVKEALLTGPFAERANQIISSFQSRFGVTKWVEPYTDVTLEELAKDGIESIDVICPAFSADCLETLEEIAQTNKQVFIENGGSEYRYIEALNAQPLFIETLFTILQQQAADWLGEKIET
ncbi:MAG: ferrochelatase [Oceanospirillaceae bacterium]